MQQPVFTQHQPTYPRYAAQQRVSHSVARSPVFTAFLDQQQACKNPFLNNQDQLNLQHTQTTSTQSAPQKRTAGMKLFDTLLYPGLTNFGVFALSLYGTYQTTYGPQNHFLKKRGDMVRKFLNEKLKMPKNSAEMAVMVAFSFLDGCLVAPLVKLFEDRRGPISKALDKALHTEPVDPSVYDAEPKQTWGTVLAGRAAASAVVVPTAVLLDKKWGMKESLNDKLFSTPGKQFGQWIEKNVPSVQKALPKLNIAGASKIAFFEAFYTSVCTLGLYLSSRAFAKNNA